MVEQKFRAGDLECCYLEVGHMFRAFAWIRTICYISGHLTFESEVIIVHYWNKLKVMKVQAVQIVVTQLYILDAAVVHDEAIQ